MKKSIIAAGFALTALLFAGPAWATRDSGLGLYMGGSRTTMTPSDSPQFDSSGPGLGIDFQFPVGDSFSVNPFFLSFKEDGDAPITDGMGNIIGSTLAKLDNKIAGLQLRYWLDGVFLGAHAGRYSTTISFPDFAGLRQKLSDTGFGAVIGWEGESGFTLVLQYDTVTYDSGGGAEVEFKSLRGLFGYRF